MALTKVTSSMTEGGDDLQTDIALLGFKVAANGSLAAYGLSKQAIDAFEDASGVDAGSSSNAVRNAANYYSGVAFGSYTTDAFTSTGASTWTCPANTLQIEVLVVGGGAGGGGRYYGGGGGAGGIVHDTDYAVVSGTVYDITVGAGGNGGGIGTIGDAGSDSVFNVNAEGSGIALTAKGGGGGSGSATAGGNGGSGGGGNGNNSGTAGGTSNQATFSGATSYGNSGAAEGNGDGGGGGGASAAGSQGTGSGGVGGAGGAGQFFSNFTAYGTTSGNVASSGSDGGYFGGGGGGSGGGHSGDRGPAGVGGGGRGGAYNNGSELAGDNGLANTGGGGGGASHTTYQTGKNGGSGVVLVRHRSESYNDISLVSNATTADSAPDKADIVMTYTNGAGTATINTDLKAYVSRDGGTTWTQATLSEDGTSGGHSILVAHNIDISSQPSGTSMKYKIETLNQSASKETRIQAVSLGWK